MFYATNIIYALVDPAFGKGLNENHEKASNNNNNQPTH